jgi:glycosyltransferase involved in cell wall biosynthesis
VKTSFISWLPHCRRSEALASLLGGKSHLIHYLGFKRPSQAIVKYPLQTLSTVIRLSRDNADLILVATPPVLAAVPVYVYARIRRVPFVIDAHTGTFFDPRWTWLLPLSRWLSRAARATIVTNDHLAQVVRSWGAQAVVIGSVPMTFPPGQGQPSGDSAKVVVINSFSRDEPVKAVLSAAKNIPHIYFDITGDVELASASLLESAPKNVHFTGWLPDQQYANLLRSATIVMVLTTRDHTMQRGAYEAMALEKPLITSDWPLLRRTFNRGTIHVDNTEVSITVGVETAVRNHQSMALEMQMLRRERNAEFEIKLNNLLAIVKKHSHFSSHTAQDKVPARL